MENERAARTLSTVPNVKVLECDAASLEDLATKRVSVTYVPFSGILSSSDSSIFDLYQVTDHASTSNTFIEPAIPFIHTVSLRCPRTGNIFKIKALFDDGAMTCVMSSRLYERARTQLSGGWRQPRRVMRMANGISVPFQATWEGNFELEPGFAAHGRFEVLPTDEEWDFLFGKPHYEKKPSQNLHGNLAKFGFRGACCIKCTICYVGKICKACRASQFEA